METGLKCVCLLLLQFSLLCMIVKIGLMASLIMTILHVLLTFLSATLLLCYALGVLYIRILVLVIVLLVAGLLLWVMACIFVLLGRLMLPEIMMLLFILPLPRLCALHFRCLSSQALEYACGQLPGFAKVLNVREMATMCFRSSLRLRTMPNKGWMSFALLFTSLPLRFSHGPV